MSATNHTTTIELSQYISTDKPTYLTDYNGDMLKIDNAFAADRDSISTAQNKANTADGKADANKTSIDTLDAQINGNPEVPSDTGLAGKVTDNSGDIDTIEALLGNGTPTTSNQTVIGAINGLEGAIAPREDAPDLANSYAIGEQFARGGSVYTALTPLTAGTAFASLTLNTDYKNSDTLVEQIADVESAISGISNNFAVESFDTTEAFTAETDETFGALMVRVHTRMQALVTALENNERIAFHACQVVGKGMMHNDGAGVFSNADTVGTCIYTGLRSASGLDVNVLIFSDAAGSMKIASVDMSDGTITPTSIATTDTAASHSISTVNLHYRKYKML